VFPEDAKVRVKSKRAILHVIHFLVILSLGEASSPDPPYCKTKSNKSKRKSQNVTN